MPLHPQSKFVLDQMAASGGKRPEQLTPAEVKAQFNAGFAARQAMAGPERPVARVENLKAGDVPIRVYWPSTKPNLPALIYMHGGGWMVGDIEMVDRPSRILANDAQCVIVSVDYPLSPDAKFPAALDVVYSVVQWVAAHSGELGIDPQRIGVGGDSAGGNLAATVALVCRDRGGPKLAFQLLVYPVTDYDDDRPSMTENDGIFLTRVGMNYYWSHYLKSPADAQSPYASPMKAASLKGLPPAFVITAECDPLRDQGEAYGERMRADGVPVKIKRYAGAIHAFFGMGAVIDSGREALADAAAAIREALGVSGAATA